ncbi:MAG: feruloyl-CoA synthase [Beijerinckiaceae bacterium]
MTSAALDKVAALDEAGGVGQIFAPPRVSVERRPDGSRILRSPEPLAAYPRCVGEWLVKWAHEAPERVFLSERPEGSASGDRIRVTYREALCRVEAIATWILRKELGPERPIAILSDNSIEHALLSLAALHVGVPVASISPTYSLMSASYEKLKEIIGLLSPAAIYVSDPGRFARALAAIAPLHKATIVAGAASGEGAGPADIVNFLDIEASTDRGLVEAAFGAINPDTIAKFLFTSGSTGSPKGVINTQRMLCASQQAKAQVWPFIEDTPPVILDWLPWNHTFGANHNFFLILRNGGTLHIDAGKPVPALFQKTIDNLREIETNIYFNVPKGFDLLTRELEKDDRLRHRFFSKLRVIFYAGAALPQNIWDDLMRLAIDTLGRPVAMVSAWGSTETSPLATDCYFQAERSGNIGLPVPGVELKLVPNGGKQEIRVRGENVTPGYWKHLDLTRAAFDEEGFYRIGDAVRFVDEDAPEKGLYFDGRIAEDFKLTSGTWVSVSNLRLKGIEHLAPIAQDIVVTGHGRDEIGFLVFANLAACRELTGLPEPVPHSDVLADEAVRNHVRDALQRLKSAGSGSSTFATRALLMAEPASVDSGEITDKGYINQRAVLVRRIDLVTKLHEDEASALVIGL